MGGGGSLHAVCALGAHGRREGLEEQGFVGLPSHTCGP